MQANSLKLKIGYLYPDILQAFCDEANIEALVLRCKERRIRTSIVKIHTGQSLAAIKSKGNIDLYYIGGSNTEMLKVACDSINQNRDELRKDALKGIPALAVNSGFILFGASFQLSNQPRIKGMGILSAEFEIMKKGISNSIIGTCDFIEKTTIVGYKNQIAKARLKSGTSPFLTVQKGFGNNFDDKTEGSRFNNIIGTFITSPLLPQNPKLCDYLIETALRIKYKSKVPLAEICDDVEGYSRNYILETK